MATDIYRPCINPITGETFQALSFSPEVFVMKWSVRPGGYVPFEHIHLNQDEIFHIQKGEMRVRMNGKDIIAGEGETIAVPRGIAHIAYNNKKEELHCIVEYKPGLDHDKFMQCINGLINDRLIDKKGGMSIPRMGYFMKMMNMQCLARPTSIPVPVFNLALNFFYWRGVVSGWGRLYERYVGR
jgi:quercetin dioxygenase-like cupin family protein